MVTITYHGRKIQLDEHMQRALEWALKNAGKWQDIGKEWDRMDAIKRLEAEGLVEIWEEINRYRVDDKALGEAKPASAGKVSRDSRRRGPAKGK